MLFKLYSIRIDCNFSLPPIGHRHPKVKALIEQTIREKKRARRSLSYMNDGEYLPHLYETDSDKKPQFSFIMAERAPWPLQDVSFGVDVFGE